MKRSFIGIAAGLALVVIAGALVTIARVPVYYATAPAYTSSPTAWRQVSGEAMGCDQGPPSPPTQDVQDLDDDPAAWGVYCEGQPTWIKESAAAPSVDGKSLRCSITGGDPYSNVHCYANMLPEPTATAFTLTLSFWFSPTTTFNNQGAPSVVQALEFTMNKWHQSKRYEFALQWQNVGSGAPQWRYWDPHQPEPWVSLGITDTLAGEQWHSLTLEGDITDDQVHYQRFAIDQRSYTLDITASPVSVPGEADRLAVAIQLDGNAVEAPYDVFIDQVDFMRDAVAEAYLPLAIK